MDAGIKKVLWQDGLPLTRDHFLGLENWIESSLAIVQQQIGFCGLFRDPLQQPTYNDYRNVSIRRIDGTLFVLEIQQFQAIDRCGILLQVDKPTKLEFNIPRSEQTSDGVYTLYLFRITNVSDHNPVGRSSGTNSGDIDEDIFYQPTLGCSITAGAGTGVPICKFSVKDNQVLIDMNYVPFGLFVDSSPMCEQVHVEFLKSFLRWDDLLEKRLRAISHSIAPEVCRETAAALFNLTRCFGVRIRQAHTLTGGMLLHLEQFFTGVHSQFFILSVAWKDENFLWRWSESDSILRKSLIGDTDDDNFPSDLSLPFAIATRSLQEMSSLLQLFTGGKPDTRYLSISHVEFIEENEGNKLVIYFISPQSLEVGKSRLVVDLHNFSNADPKKLDVRCGLGVYGFWGGLERKSGVLKSIPGERNSYQIECSTKIINVPITEGMVVYVPSPLGKDIADLAKCIKISMIE